MVELAATAGLVLDPWQKLVMDYGLDENIKTGKYAAREVGIVVSRQNGKGSILEALELADLFLLDGELTIHSAHWFPTSQDALRRLTALIESSSDLDKMFTRCRGKVWQSNGKEGIELYRDGKKRRLKFQTRTKSGGRGLTGDRVVIDEAMIYDEDMDAALRPTMSARDIINPSGTQMWLLGSAGDGDSVIFGKARHRALKGTDPRLCFMEWSIDACSALCPPLCEEHDVQDESRGWEPLLESYAKSNPGLGIRISIEACESERHAMGPERFAQERLGVGRWPVEGEAWSVVSSDAWEKRMAQGLFPPKKPLAFAIDTTPDRRWSCISVAGTVGDDMVGAEVTSGSNGSDFRPGTQWVVQRAVEIFKANKGSIFVIDKGSQALGYIDELEAAGVTLLLPTAREYAEACGALVSSITGVGSEPTFFHGGQPALTQAIAGAEQRPLSDLWAWDKRAPMVNISPLVSVTLAVLGHKKLITKPKPKPKGAWG